MNNDDNPDLERKIRDRIDNFGQADTQAKQATEEELRRLRFAAGRLDQWLADLVTDEEAERQRVREKESQSLREGAARLDRLLAEIAGKEGVPELKRRKPVNDDLPK